MSGITQGYTDANIAIFGLSAKIKADFVGGAGDKVIMVFKDFNDFNDLNDLNDLKVFNAPDAIKKSPKILRGGEILLTLYIIGKTKCDEVQNQTRLLDSRSSPKRKATKISHTRQI